MYLDMQSGKAPDFCKDTIYRLKNSVHINWLRFTTLLSASDHAHHRYVRGFRMLTLGWSDGVSFIPVNACLLSTENRKNRINEAKQVNKQAFGAKIREMAQSKATDVMLNLIQEAQTAKIKAKYVLFDSWFTCPKTILALKKMHLDT